MKKPGTTTRRNGTVRCAIYTRKSSEEGLEQEFNSLQAQREACEAFIDSQRHEGWVCQRAAYDDGGFSGATLDRPALQQLLADVKAGRVDTIVVYKIDRLTRSLADFAKIVEILDARGASFVSVTQQFETIHNGQSYVGEHEPIIDQPLCDAVQAQLVSNAAQRNDGARTRQPCLLAGMLFDGDGNRMTPSHAVKRGTRFG